MDDDTRDTVSGGDGVKDASPAAMDIKPSATMTAPPAGSPEASSGSDTTKVSEPSSSAEVKVDMEGNLSGAPTADSPKTEFKQLTSADLNSDDSFSNPTTPPQPAKKKSSGLVIIIAVIIFLALAGAAYFAYKNNKKTTTTTKTTSTVASSNQAKASDIDQTNQGIDKDLSSINDNTDFASTDLSDVSLGL